MTSIPPVRVAVTGVAVASPLGVTLDAMWARLSAGECGFSLRTGDASRDLPDRLAAFVSDEDLAAGLERFEIREPDRPMQMGLYVVAEALSSAGIPTDGEKPLPHAFVMGTGHGNIAFQHDMLRAYEARGRRGIRPTSVVRIMFNRAANLPAIQFNLTGPNHLVCAACASGTVAFGEAYHKVRHGVVPAAVAACTDSGLENATFSAWEKLGVLSKEMDPASAARPFSADRAGLVMGEGAAAFVLEPLHLAVARGAKVWAEVIGYGASSDASHIVKPDAGGEARAIGAALAEAGIEPGSAAGDGPAIDYINLHGTGMEFADRAEAEAITTVFGEAAASIPCSSLKGQIGHCMGAAAGLELAVTLEAVRRGSMPASHNLGTPDPECKLGFVTQTRDARIGVAMKNAFAFGGSNTVLLLRASDT